MSKLHHFVVYWDSVTGKWEQDPDAAEIHFDRAPIYDTETEEWERVDSTNSADDNKAYRELTERLA